MILPLSAVEVPLVADGHGGLRVSGTRVLLERIVRAFENGATPEGIVESYDTLNLVDVYAVISWFLKHRDEVHDYLDRRDREAAAIREEIESKQPDWVNLRARLRHTPSGQVG